MTGRHWRHDTLTAAAAGPTILVRVIDSLGSAPRDAGTRMLITKGGQVGTIGGGNLEYEATRDARAMLQKGMTTPRLVRFPLGPMLNQCCGGNVLVMLQPIGADSWSGVAAAATDLWLYTDTRSGDHSLMTAEAAAVAADIGDGNERRAVYLLGDRQNPDAILEPLSTDIATILLFGAGHVGQALVTALAPLPFDVRWVDSRSDQFPDIVPENTAKYLTADPVSAVRAAPSGASYLVMTHDHDLDYALVAAILTRGDARHVGLIGSMTKRARFESRLRKEARLDQTAINRMRCPIGIADIGGKDPAIIAASVAAELLSVLSPAVANQTARQTVAGT